MNLASTFIMFAWYAHEARIRWRGAGNLALTEYFEGKRNAYLSAARMCRNEAKTALAGKKER
jgi:hypothetical protein